MLKIFLQNSFFLNKPQKYRETLIEKNKSSAWTQQKNQKKKLGGKTHEIPNRRKAYLIEIQLWNDPRISSQIINHKTKKIRKLFHYQFRTPLELFSTLYLKNVNCSKIKIYLSVIQLKIAYISNHTRTKNYLSIKNVINWFAFGDIWRIETSGNLVWMVDKRQICYSGL